MSRSEVEQCIRHYLREHDGSAPAGDVTAHAVAAGHPESTVRRIAGRIVEKTREGNSFRWSLRPEPTFTASPAPEMPSVVGQLVDKSRKPTLWDAMKLNGVPMSHDPFTRYAPAKSSHDEDRRDRLAEPEGSEPEPGWVSKYAGMSQSERLHLMTQRPTIAALEIAIPIKALTDAEAIVTLECDDAGLYALTASPSAGAPRTALPY